MSMYSFVSRSESDTDELGALIASAVRPGEVLSLVGTLGAGKTRLVQGIAVAMGNPAESITSPTFVLVNEYRAGRLPVYHFDVYRLKDDDEFLELGPEEYFAGDGITLIEWGDRVDHLLPEGSTVVRIELTNQDERQVLVEGPLAERIASLAS